MKYMINQEEEIQLKARLSSDKAIQIFELIKIEQPDRLNRMIKDRQLISFLNNISFQYLRKIQLRIDDGATESEAASIEWPLLKEQAGLK